MLLTTVFIRWMLLMYGSAYFLITEASKADLFHIFGQVIIFSTWSSYLMKILCWKINWKKNLSYTVWVLSLICSTHVYGYSLYYLLQVTRDKSIRAAFHRYLFGLSSSRIVPKAVGYYSKRCAPHDLSSLVLLRCWSFLISRVGQYVGPVVYSRPIETAVYR
jgi:hypothetical protein